jgi:hypothetical protein
VPRLWTAQPTVAVLDRRLHHIPDQTPICPNILKGEDISRKKPPISLDPYLTSGFLRSWISDEKNCKRWVIFHKSHREPETLLSLIGNSGTGSVVEVIIISVILLAQSLTYLQGPPDG